MKWKFFLAIGGIVMCLGAILTFRSALLINTSSLHTIAVTTEGEVVANDGVILHWWKYDRGTPLTTIVLHGGPKGKTEWIRNKYGNQLADAFGTIVFFDRRGCGVSQQEHVSAESMTFDQAGDDLIAVLQVTTQNDAPIVLFGHSFGGTLLVHVAPRLGERLKGVIFSSPFFDMEAELAGRSSLPSHCVPQEMEKDVPATPECTTAVYSGWNMNEHYLTTSHLEELASLTVPTVMFTGECDPLANSAVVKTAQEALPNIEYHQLSSKSHRSLFESIGTARPWITEFMASLTL